MNPAATSRSSEAEGFNPQNVNYYEDTASNRSRCGPMTISSPEGGPFCGMNPAATSRSSEAEGFNPQNVSYYEDTASNRSRCGPMTISSPEGGTVLRDESRSYFPIFGS